MGRDFQDLPKLKLGLIQDGRLLYVQGEHHKAILDLNESLGWVGENLPAAISDHNAYPDVVPRAVAAGDRSKRRRLG